MNHTLDEADLGKERYYHALEYMEWFEPAWRGITDDERFIISALYFFENVKKTECILTIGEKFDVERAQVYRYRDKASEHLTMLLYGK